MHFTDTFLHSTGMGVSELGWVFQVKTQHYLPYPYSKVHFREMKHTY